MRKKILFIVIVLIFLAVYSIPSFLFPVDDAYYDKLIKPSYIPPKMTFMFVWMFIYILLSIYFTRTILQEKFKKVIVLFIIHYFSLFYYPKAFWIDGNLYFAVVLSITSFLSGLFIFILTFKEERKWNSLLVPYILWTLFATILQIHIYILN